jgi:hypothetical protein
MKTHNNNLLPRKYKNCNEKHDELQEIIHWKENCENENESLKELKKNKLERRTEYWKKSTQKSTQPCQ